MEKTTDQPDLIENWRNSRLLVWLIYFSGMLMLLMGVLLELGALGTLMPFRWSAIGEAFMLSGLGLGVAWGAVSVWKMGRRASTRVARFEQDAICFCNGKAVTDRIAWDGIVGVSQGGGQVTIRCSDGQFLSFDGFMFFFPSRLGKAIAARAGKEFNAPELAEATS